MTPSELIKLETLAKKYVDEGPNLRNGQALFNALYVLHPNIANELRATSCDAYYNDNKINDFYKFILEWEN